MTNRIIFRILLDAFIAIAVFHAWWFIALPLALFCIWQYPFFLEIIIAGFIYDALFGSGSASDPWSYLGTIVSIICMAAVAGMKKVVRK